MKQSILFFLALTILFPALGRANDGRANDGRANDGREKTTQNSTTNKKLDLSPNQSLPLKITPQDNSKSANSEDVNKPTGMFGAAVKTFFSLLVVISLIFATAWMLKKNKITLGGSNASEVLEVLGKRTVAQRQSIYLVRLGSRILVLGSGTDGLTSLSEITDPVEVDYLAGLCKSSSQNTETPLSFLSMFRKENRPRSAPNESALVSSVEIRSDDAEEGDDNTDDELPLYQYEEEVNHA